MFGALGELDYEPATEFYLNYLQKNVQFIHFGYFSLKHFNFDIKYTDDILDFYLLGKYSYSFENSIQIQSAGEHEVNIDRAVLKSKNGLFEIRLRTNYMFCLTKMEHQFQLKKYAIIQAM